MHPHPDILVIGAGPAGLMAALSAAEAGARVLVLERLNKPGTKLLATGGGRCNLTNVLAPEQLMPCFGRQGRFMAPALRALDNLQLLETLRQLGVEAHCADGFHWFPVAESAAVVQQALWQRCEELGVDFRFGCQVQQLEFEAGKLVGVIDSHGNKVPGRRAILAGGGKSWPGLGSDGSGLQLAAGIGLAVTPTYPGLVPIVVGESWVASCAGIVFEEAEVWIDFPKLRGERTRGPLLFTHRGLSGPAILDLSGRIAALLATMPEVPIRIRWQPAPAAAAWRERFDAWRREHGAKMVRNLLDQNLPGSFAAAIAVACGLGDTRAAGLTSEQAGRLAECLAECPLHAIDTEGFAKSMVTHGGIALKEIDPGTLECKRRPGLFVAGEIVDLDGPCGGYNLQWAFSSGRLAGLSAARP